MRLLTAFEAVLAGTAPRTRGQMRWEPFLLLAIVTAVMAEIISGAGFNAVSMGFRWGSLIFMGAVAAMICAAASAHLKAAPDA